ncbi:MAG: hypothetical protein JNM56_37185 [Planctomycetia bacterium]|nr:hypothetical protein [Planctomycetia bacterium]
MLTHLNDVCLRLGDLLFGWLLYLPTDAVIIVVALGTSAILTFVRLLTTNQDLLTRCRQDKQRLRELMRAAKQAKDPEAIQRYRATSSSVAMKVLRAEGKPLVASLMPISLLAVWCLARLEFHPPRQGELVEVRAYFPASAIGQVAHIAPQPGLDASEGWIQKIEEDPVRGPDGGTNGLAIWKLRAADRAEPYALAIRQGGTTRQRVLLVGTRHYPTPVEVYDDGGRVLGTEVVMRPVQLFGIVPGIPALFFPPWLVAYLLIAIPFVWLLKHAFDIC